MSTPRRKQLLLEITHRENLGLGSQSLTLCSSDAILHIKGKDINWMVPLSDISSINVIESKGSPKDASS